MLASAFEVRNKEKTKLTLKDNTMPNPIMQYFEYAHLPAHLQGVSKLVGDLAKQVDNLMPDSAEKTAGLRKLLEAKDCLVRASLPARPNPKQTDLFEPKVF
jgi:hypothetical protein